MSILGVYKQIADCVKIHYTTFSKKVSKRGGDKNWFFKT